MLTPVIFTALWGRALSSLLYLWGFEAQRGWAAYRLSHSSLGQDQDLNVVIVDSNGWHLLHTYYVQSPVLRALSGFAEGICAADHGGGTVNIQVQVKSTYSGQVKVQVQVKSSNLYRVTKAV